MDGGEELRRLVGLVERHSPETGAHLERVGRMSYWLAMGIGHERRRAALIGLASHLHDLGKVVIPNGILRKPARLTPTERAVIERHADAGRDLLSDSSGELLELARSIAHTHHERFDGRGYPRGLAAEAIPLEGRLVAVADAFDALTHDRPYRKAFPVDEAAAMMTAGRGSHFDPELLDVLLDRLPDASRSRPPGRPCTA